MRANESIGDEDQARPTTPQFDRTKSQSSFWSLSRVGGSAIFIVILFAYVIQCELTQAVQRTYQKPYLLLYLTHSGYIFVLPIHLLILKFIEPSISLNERLKAIKRLIILRFDQQSQSIPPRLSPIPSRSTSPDVEPLLTQTNLVWKPFSQRFPSFWFIKRSIQLTLFLAIPAICWYAAVPLADMTSITSIFNTNACFTYIFAVWFLESESFQTRKTIGVIGSFIGSLMISYSEESPSSSSPDKDLPHPHLHHRIFGIGFAFLGSIGYALYEVWYKKVIAFTDPHSSPRPSPKPTVTSGPEAFILSNPHRDAGRIAAEDEVLNPVSEEEEGQQSAKSSLESTTIFEPDSTGSQTIDNRVKSMEKHNSDGLLYSNVMTTMVGIMTILLMWIPIPILNWSGLERFEPIDNYYITLMIIGIVVMGVTFNAGFMILLGLWGPILASVGNLCTLVLIALVDRTFLGSMNDIDGPRKVPNQFSWITFLGCLLVLGGFSILSF